MKKTITPHPNECWIDSQAELPSFIENKFWFGSVRHSRKVFALLEDESIIVASYGYETIDDTLAKWMVYSFQDIFHNRVYEKDIIITHWMPIPNSDF